jgi:protein SCO1/2
MFFNHLFSVVVVSLLSLTAQAHENNTPWRTVPTASNEVPVALEDVGITEHLGEAIDLTTTFKDETGQTVELNRYFSGHKPVLLSLVYYGCPGLCNFHLNGVTDALKELDWNLGKEFEMVVISIDPSEDPEMATQKKSSYVKALGRDQAASGWHFLTGKKENIEKIASQVGFRFHWDKLSKQWAHTSAMYVLSPLGKISRYLYGIQFDPKTVRLSLVEASQGKTGTVLDHLILYCFQYDPNRKTYAFYAYNIVRAGGGIAGLALLALLIPTWLRERRKSKVQGDS